MKLIGAIGLATLSLSAVGHAQVTGQRSDSTCLDLRDDRITATGLLRVEAFPGPPNYESIKGGDREEDAFMLQIPEPDCVEEDASTAEMFVDLHVSSMDDEILKKLKGLTGRKVTVSGTAVTAETAHHRAPVVLMATKAEPSSK